MSLSPCRECGHRVSSKATACPSCGLPDPVSSAGCGCRGLLLLALFGVLAFGVGVAARLWEGPRPPDPGAPFTESVGSGVESAAPGPSPAPSTFPGLAVRLARSDGSIHLTNADSFAWSDCKIDLNAGSFPGGYSTDVARIGAGEGVSAKLETFLRGGREPFGPSTRVVSVDVHCDTPFGRAHHAAVFR